MQLESGRSQVVNQWSKQEGEQDKAIEIGRYGVHHNARGKSTQYGTGRTIELFNKILSREKLWGG